MEQGIGGMRKETSERNGRIRTLRILKIHNRKTPVFPVVSQSFSCPFPVVYQSFSCRFGDKNKCALSFYCRFGVLLMYMRWNFEQCFLEQAFS
jgi:hypothetical protein